MTSVLIVMPRNTVQREERDREAQVRRRLRFPYATPVVAQMRSVADEVNRNVGESQSLIRFYKYHRCGG
eukprot:COSAG01_NODE_3393_length_6149_cov_24.742149_2_plen_69_part_00